LVVVAVAVIHLVLKQGKMVVLEAVQTGILEGLFLEVLQHLDKAIMVVLIFLVQIMVLAVAVALEQ
jgi:hypothetical protein